eukprot:GHVS01052826.1.p1 GENE.GHVS01052826.1~~GHVS01052826.1.p1  ORF type:complete len:471 (+),score=129.48 GHVS01052826.1:87-1415(+)
MSVTPTSDSNTTSADTPPASAGSSPQNLKLRGEEGGSGGGGGAMMNGRGGGGGGKPSIGVHPDYPDAKVLLISSKRPRSFFERTVRELLAGGTDVVVLSALGDAIPLCVLLQTSLEEKNAASLVKIETTYNPYNNRNGSYSASPPTAGLRIYMKKHEQFKGSRISPGYVTFVEGGATTAAAAAGGGAHTPVYDAEPKERCGAVNCGDPGLYVGGAGINKAFAEVLSQAGQSVEQYENVHKTLLDKATEENKEKTLDSDVRACTLMEDELSPHHTDLKMAMCRPCKLLEGCKTPTTGCVFLSVFKDDKVPCNQEKNQCMVYVVGPKGTDFETKENFIDAVKHTAVNLMTMLCDYNGVSRRHGAAKGLQKLNNCRIALFSGGAFLHEGATKLDVAKAILSGLEEGYRHGPAPRLNFVYDEDVFKQGWTEITGLDVYDHISSTEE